MTTDVFAHSVKLRPGHPSDVEPCARILFNAFGTIAAHHNFPPDIPSIEVGAELMTMLLTHPQFSVSWQKSTAKSSAAIFLTSALQSLEWARLPSSQAFRTAGSGAG
jgi:hypothetical protein